MIERTKFEKIWEIEDKIFGLLKKPWKVSENNVRRNDTEIAIRDIKVNLVPNIKNIGLQQIPVVNGKGEVFIGGRRTTAVKIIGGTKTLLVEIRDIPAEEQLIASWSENYVKKDMRADEEGEVFKKIIDRTKISQRELGKKLRLSKDTINRKIRVYKEFKVARNAPVPHDTTHDSAKTFNFGKAIELLPEWISSDEKTKMMNEIKTKGMTTSEVRKVVNTSKTMMEVAEKFDKKTKEKVLKRIRPQLFAKGLDPIAIIYEINEVTKSSHKTVPKKLPLKEFETQEEADEKYFIPRGGRCLGKTTEEYWYGTINKARDKLLREAEKNAKKKK